MNDYGQIVDKIMDAVDDGIIYIGNNQELKLFNHRAKEILGVIIDKSKSHSAGKIQSGDIMIIANNCIGGDDGGMTPERLKDINVSDTSIKEGDAFIGVGVFKNSAMAPVYKYWRNPHVTSSLEVDTTYLGFKIKASIDLHLKKMVITVNGDEYVLNYINEIAHIVIIDGKTGIVKFFQKKGYTVRRETLIDIISGCEYMSKGESSSNMEVKGRKLEDIIEQSELTDKIAEIMTSEEPVTVSDFYGINKRPTYCTLIPIKLGDKIDGVVLKVRDVTGLEALLNDRNRIIDYLEKIKTGTTTRKPDYPEDAFTGFTGNSPAIIEIKYLAYRASKFKSNVIITGESGTGKSQLAKEIHKLYAPDAPFVDVNCSSIPHNLFESELFGYVGGAFTGALSGGKEGYFEIASGGTIFLDEIGEIPLDIQVKLLQVLQNKRFYRVGSSKPINVNVRVIAATNKNLKDEVEKGNFRQDLYYRLNVFPIEIPPLRERKSDIYLLINSILNRISAEYGIEPKQLSGQALSMLLGYSWPGNVRELENVLERAVTICESDKIYPEHINIDKKAATIASTLRDAVAATERSMIEKAAREFNGDKKLIMDNLSISKSAFYEKLKKYNIDI